MAAISYASIRSLRSANFPLCSLRSEPIGVAYCESRAGVYSLSRGQRSGVPQSLVANVRIRV